MEKINDLNHKLFRHEHQGGAVLIFFISLILAMSVLTGYMLDLTTTSTFGELSYNHLERAYFMAEAGGNYANKLVKLDIETNDAYDDTYLLHDTTFTLDDVGGDQEGQFKILVDDTDPGYTLVHSIGTVTASISSNVEVKLTYSMTKTNSVVFDEVLFAGGVIQLKKDVTIVGDIGTNDSSIKKDTGVTITGDEETNVGKTLVPINFSCGTCMDDKEVNGSETWFGDTYEYNKVTIKSSSTLTISGDVILYVKEDFTAEKESTIKILLNSSLTLYVDKKVEFNKEFAVEFDPQPDRAKDFVIYGTSNIEIVLIGKDITFIGAIYAPTADIDIQKAQKFVGAVVGNNISVDKEGTVTYDESVKDIITPVGISRIVLGPPKQYFSS